jgi:hypothetical protein
MNSLLSLGTNLLKSGVNKRSAMTYQLVSVASGILGGVLAGAVFTQIWRLLAGADHAPQPSQLDREMREVLVAGAIQGAVAGLVRAVLGRVTAKGYRQVTGHAPQQ